MRHSISVGVVLWALSGIGTAVAAPLTCEVFKNRLFEAVKQNGHVAQPMAFTEAYKASDKSATYDWHGVVGISGVLKCSPTDGFREFDATMDYPADHEHFSMFESRVKSLAASTLCALSSSNSGQCGVTASQMHAAAEREYSTQYANGEEDPVGARTLQIFDGVSAEFDVKKSSVLWYVGPTDHDISDVRAALNPRAVN